MDKIIFGFILVILASQANCVEYAVKLSNQVRLVVREENFDVTKHTMSGCAQPRQVCKIDGYFVHGAVGIPKSSLQSLIVSAGDKTYNLDITGMYDPFLSNSLNDRFGGFCYDPENCSFRAILGDAGGVYAVEWVIVNGSAHRTILTDSQDIFEFFKSNLTPPQYH